MAYAMDFEKFVTDTLTRMADDTAEIKAQTLRTNGRVDAHDGKLLDLFNKVSNTESDIKLLIEKKNYLNGVWATVIIVATVVSVVFGYFLTIFLKK